MKTIIAVVALSVISAPTFAQSKDSLRSAIQIGAIMFHYDKLCKPGDDDEILKYRNRWNNLASFMGVSDFEILQYEAAGILPALDAKSDGKADDWCNATKLEFERISWDKERLYFPDGL